ncbi:MAG: hypothetical protein LBT12_01555, partial [Oscillospiraceae bacterium]|nr:hypothetical protein [Oscillospiraceae bacterium]
NIAEDGNTPEYELTQKYALRYAERTVGLTRYYTALQADVRVQYVLRCPLRRGVSSQDVAVPNDGKQYRIERVQHSEGVAPPYMDLTLEALEENYAI